MARAVLENECRREQRGRMEKSEEKRLHAYTVFTCSIAITYLYGDKPESASRVRKVGHRRTPRAAFHPESFFKTVAHLHESSQCFCLGEAVWGEPVKERSPCMRRSMTSRQNFAWWWENPFPPGKHFTNDLSSQRLPSSPHCRARHPMSCMKMTDGLRIPECFPRSIAYLLVVPFHTQCKATGCEARAGKGGMPKPWISLLML